MKLINALEIGNECGLETVGESIYNIEIHAGNLFSYSEINKELAELQSEYNALVSLFPNAANGSTKKYLSILQNEEKYVMRDKKVYLRLTNNFLYPNELPHDEVFCIVNENDVTIGLVYISYLENGNIYIDWLETLMIFHGKGYLRLIFKALKERFQTEIQFECSEKLRPKYLRIGCVEHGISDTTELYRMSY